MNSSCNITGIAIIFSSKICDCLLCLAAALLLSKTIFSKPTIYRVEALAKITIDSSKLLQRPVVISLSLSFTPWLLKPSKRSARVRALWVAASLPKPLPNIRKAQIQIRYTNFYVTNNRFRYSLYITIKNRLYLQLQRVASRFHLRDSHPPSWAVLLLP